MAIKRALDFNWTFCNSYKNKEIATSKGSDNPPAGLWVSGSPFAPCCLGWIVKDSTKSLFLYELHGDNNERWPDSLTARTDADGGRCEATSSASILCV